MWFTTLVHTRLVKPALGLLVAQEGMLVCGEAGYGQEFDKFGGR